MKTYLEFHRLRKKKGQKTERFMVKHVLGNPEIIGLIRWHGAWRQYVLDPERYTFWSKGCLETVAKFLDKLNKRQRQKWRKP